MVYPRGSDPMTKRIPGVTTTSLQQATAGTYQTDQVNTSGNDLTAGTEYELAIVATNILANTASKDEVFSWIRFHMYTADTAQATAGEWFLLRLLQTDADPDLDSEDIVEALQKDKRILERGWWKAGQAANGNLALIKFEKFQVKLRYGEELRLLLLPYYIGAAQFFYGRLEWRQQGK